jgi:hypothetical protein
MHLHTHMIFSGGNMNFELFLLLLLRISVNEASTLM